MEKFKEKKIASVMNRMMGFALLSFIITFIVATTLKSSAFAVICIMSFLVALIGSVLWLMLSGRPLYDKGLYDKATKRMLNNYDLGELEELLVWLEDRILNESKTQYRVSRSYLASFKVIHNELASRIHTIVAIKNQK